MKGPLDCFGLAPIGLAKGHNEIVGNINTIWEDRGEKINSYSKPAAKVKKQQMLPTKIPRKHYSSKLVSVNYKEEQL